MLPIYLHTPFPFNLSPLLSTYSFPFQPFSILYLYTPFPFNLSPLLSTYSFPFQPFSILYLYTPFPFNLSPSFIYILLFLSTFLHLLSMYSFPCQPFFPPLPIYSLPCSKPSLILYLYTPFPVILYLYTPFFSTCLPFYLYTHLPVILPPFFIYTPFLFNLSPPLSIYSFSRSTFIPPLCIFLFSSHPFSLLSFLQSIFHSPFFPSTDYPKYILIEPFKLLLFILGLEASNILQTTTRILRTLTIETKLFSREIQDTTRETNRGDNQPRILIRVNQDTEQRIPGY